MKAVKYNIKQKTKKARMKKEAVLGSVFMFVGTLILMTNVTITGAVIGTGSVNYVSFVGLIIFVLGGVIVGMAGNSREEIEKYFREGVQGIDQVLSKKGWVPYSVTLDSAPKDRAQGLGYLSTYESPVERPNLVSRIERSVNGGKLIYPYIGEDSDVERKKVRESSNKKNNSTQKGYPLDDQTVNRKTSYEEQFYEPHASKGGRIIDASSHVIKRKFLSPSTWFKSGRLEHFDKLANGKYMWVVDTGGNLVLGNRGNSDEEGELEGLTHDMYQMPPNFGSGEIHDKKDSRKITLPHSTLGRGKDVLGAGELTLENGLIREFNGDSGHYRKEIADVGGPREPYNYNIQSIDVFKYFTEKIGLKEAKGGAKFNSKHFTLDS